MRAIYVGAEKGYKQEAEFIMKYTDPAETGWSVYEGGGRELGVYGAQQQFNEG
jgi:hypothetical protein